MSATYSAGSRGIEAPKVINVPRWLEVSDRRPGPDRYDPRRTAHYVVSPHLHPEDADELASALERHAQKERNANLLEALWAPALIVAIILAFFVLTAERSLWVIAGVGVALVLFRRYMTDLSTEAQMPFDVEAIQREAGERLFHKITPTEYRQATRVMTRNAAAGVEAHEAMWRAYEMTEHVYDLEVKIAQIEADAGRRSPQIRLLDGKLRTLRDAANKAHEHVQTLINPKYRTRTKTTEAVAALNEEIDAALAGIEQFAGPTDDTPGADKVAAEVLSATLTEPMPRKTAAP